MLNFAQVLARMAERKNQMDRLLLLLRKSSTRTMIDSSSHPSPSSLAWSRCHSAPSLLHHPCPCAYPRVHAWMHSRYCSRLCMVRMAPLTPRRSSVPYLPQTDADPLTRVQTTPTPSHAYRRSRSARGAQARARRCGAEADGAGAACEMAEAAGDRAD